MASSIKDGAILASDQSAIATVTSGMNKLTASADQKEEKKEKEEEEEYWTRLPVDIDAVILGRVPFPIFFQKLSVCKSFRDIPKRKTFQQERARLFSRECSLSPIVFYVKDMLWHILGYDYANQKWRRLPPFDKRIPIPNMDLFKDFLVTSHGGLFCVNVGKPTDPERILVFNPSTGETTEIPPLKFTRHPVLLSMHVTLTKSEDTVTSSYRIVAVGSSTTKTETVSRKTEIYDSTKGKWEDAGDVPGTDFSVNEHQSGVICERLNLLLVTGFMHNGSKGLLAFDFSTRKWREDWLCPYYRDQADELNSPVHFAIAQLVLCDGEIYLFSEQEEGRAVNHCIDKLDLFSHGGYTWTRKVKRPRQGYRALLVYPEYTCVPVRDNKLCIFNTIERTGVIYNMSAESINPDVYEVVPTTPVDGIVFHSLNPVEYAYEPSFGASV